MSLYLEKSEKVNKGIKKRLNYTFSVGEKGIYTIAVSAKAKSWFQNTRKFVSFFQDDDLAVSINGTRFPKLSGERGDFDGEAAWNGNKLKGLRQVNFFITYFDQGEQNLEFFSKALPLLESIEIYKVSSNQISIDLTKYEIEDGNRRPWLNIITFNVGVIDLFAKATANLGKNKDDNDLQIRIDGRREKNNASKAHQYWYWCGRVLRGQSKTLNKALNLKHGIHYIEFWADRIPVLIELNIRVTKSERIPTVDDPLWTGDFYDDSEEMILARLIFGEARDQSKEARSWVAKVVLNRKESKGWTANTIHEVILQSGQFDPFKPTDKKNYPRIINPLGISSEANVWRECYKIAEKAINGGLGFDTEATHFHSYKNSGEIEWFEQNIVPHGKLLKKVGDIYFYWSPN